MTIFDFVKGYRELKLDCGCTWRLLSQAKSYLVHVVIYVLAFLFNGSKYKLMQYKIDNVHCITPFTQFLGAVVPSSFSEKLLVLKDWKSIKSFVFKHYNQLIYSLNRSSVQIQTGAFPSRTSSTCTAPFQSRRLATLKRHSRLRSTTLITTDWSVSRP